MMKHPDAGDVIEGTGGLRVIYYWWDGGSQFWLFTLYDKNEMIDLSAEEKRAFKSRLKMELELPVMKKQKRHLFSELMQGLDDLADARLDKQTLRTHEVQARPAPEVAAGELLVLRERLHLSRPVFAHYLHTNPCTLENWEQGRAKPNAQAALLIRLVEKFPDTVERLAVV